MLKSSQLDTPLGPMLAIADAEALYMLDFADRNDLGRKVGRLRTKATITPGTTAPIISITKELESYFDGNLQAFKTPVHLVGSPFQKLAWDALVRIPYGETKSYAEQALAIGKPSAFRAVANANGANPLAIVIPCHRIINSNGALGGYGGGIQRKQWLIAHEQHCPTMLRVY